MKVYLIPAILIVLSSLPLSGCNKAEAELHAEGEIKEQHKLVVTSPSVQDVITTEEYVCQIHSCRHIDVCAFESNGYLEEIQIQEGQSVKQGDLLFKIVPTLYQAKLDSEKAECQKEQIEFNNTQKLLGQNLVSEQELALAKAKLEKAKANVQRAEVELNFTEIRAPFDGIIDRLHEQQGSLVEQGELLTTLSDNSVMWVYFYVQEDRYFEYKAGMKEDEKDLEIQLVLANDTKFNQKGKIGAIEADFNNETGNIAFRADFPNPDGLLRHGQTGTVLINHTLHDAIVIPQRATFEILDKRFVYIVGEDNVVHQREIHVQHEMEDIFVIKNEDVNPKEIIVFEGVRQVRDGDKIEFDFRTPEKVLSNLKNEAE